MASNASRKSEAKEEAVNLIIQRSDMKEETQQEAIRAIKRAWKERLGEGTVMEKDLAAIIKQHMDKSYQGTTWHCIVGTHFAASISHATRSSIVAVINSQMSVLLFRSQE